MTELPIHAATRVAAAKSLASDASEPSHPPVPASPSTKLGFSFEMMLPLSVRTE